MWWLKRFFGAAPEATYEPSRARIKPRMKVIRGELPKWVVVLRFGEALESMEKLIIQRCKELGYHDHCWYDYDENWDEYFWIADGYVDPWRVGHGPWNDRNTGYFAIKMKDGSWEEHHFEIPFGQWTLIPVTEEEHHGILAENYAILAEHIEKREKRKRERVDWWDDWYIQIENPYQYEFEAKRVAIWSNLRDIIE